LLERRKKQTWPNHRDDAAAHSYSRYQQSKRTVHVRILAECLPRCLVRRIPRKVLAFISREVLCEQSSGRKFSWKAWAEHRMEQGTSLENKPDYSRALDQKTFRSVTRRAVAIPLILIVVFAAFTLWQLASRINDAAWVDHTDRAIALGQEVAFDFANSSANLRGYLLVGDDALLAQSQDSYREALEDLKTLGALVSDNPPQIARLESVLRMSAGWKEYADKELELKKTGGDYGAVIRSGVTIERMADVQSELAKFASVERDLRTRRSAISGRGNFYSVIFLTVASLLIGGLLALLARRDVETIAAMFETALQNEAGA